MLSHMPVTGSSGVDVYEDGMFIAAIRPSGSDGGWFEGSCAKKEQISDIEINSPLYNGITHIFVDVLKDDHIFPHRMYSIDVPVVFYGSSITQDTCTSRPGNTYVGFLSRWLDFDYINLGFS